jgi:hypothetical protein
MVHKRSVLLALAILVVILVVGTLLPVLPVPCPGGGYFTFREARCVDRGYQSNRPP